MHRAGQRCFVMILIMISGSRYDFPGVNHEGRQTCQFFFHISIISLIV